MINPVVSIEFKEVTSTERNFNSVVGRILKLDIMKVSAIAKRMLIDDTVSRGWKRFRKAIDDEKRDEDTAAIFIDDAASGGPLSPKVIAGFLNYGTTDHVVKPVNKKALHWTSKVVSPAGFSAKMKTGQFFSKGHTVSGIKATGFWKLTSAMVKKMNDYISQFIHKAAQ
jgi:hypothetical protein